VFKLLLIILSCNAVSKEALANTIPVTKANQKLFNKSFYNNFINDDN